MSYSKASYRNINQHIAGYRNLSPDEKKRITEFSLIWQIFECKVFDTEATASKIRGGGWTNDRHAEILASSNPSFEHFADRYSGGENADVHLENLIGARGQNLRTCIVTGLNQGATAKDKVVACGAVCMRLRNNLFHGVKANYGFVDQRTNFKSATAFMNVCIGELG